MRADVTDPEHLPPPGRGLRFSHSNVAEFEVSSNVPEKKKFFLSTTCVDILMRNFFDRDCPVGVDFVASCLCCRSGVAEGVSASRTNRTWTCRRNVLSVFSMALTIVTGALDVERRIPEERNVHLFVCKVECLSFQGQKLIAMNFGYFVHGGFVRTSFKKPHGNRLSPLTDLHYRLCSTPNGRVHFGKATSCSG